MDQILQRIAGDANTLVPALYTLLVAAAIDLATGLLAAATSGSLQWTYVSEFVRGHLLQKVAPIMLSLVAGVAVGGVDTVAGAALLAAGVTGGLAYLASSIASIGSNVKAASTKTKGLPSTITPQGELLTADVGVSTPWHFYEADVAEPPDHGLRDRFEGGGEATPDSDEAGDSAPALRARQTRRNGP